MNKLYTALVLTLFVLPLVAQNIPSYVPKDGLVGYWPFNGNANDESGNGNHGTVNGATLTADRNGVANNAYSFDGENDFIKITNSLIKGGYQSYTISYWFNKLAPTTSTQAVINDRNSMTSGYKYYSNFVNYLPGSGVQACSANQDITSISCVSSKSNNQSNGNWNNIIITLSAQNNIAKIYLNGVEEGSKLFNPTSWPISTNSTYLGGSPLVYGDEQWLDGKLDDVTFYNRALSDQEIKQLYEGCTKETAISNSFNSYIFTNKPSVNLTATPSGGAFSGEAVTNNVFNPSKAKLGKNQVKYNFKNSIGCADSTNFTMILVDTLGNKCSTYDTLKIKVKLTTGIKVGQQTSMNVYPNPVSEVLIIEANDIQALSGYIYKIVDLQGKEVYNALATSAKTEISLKSIGSKGIFILHIVDEKGVSIENKKIVLE